MSNEAFFCFVSRVFFFFTGSQALAHGMCRPRGAAEGSCPSLSGRGAARVEEEKGKEERKINR